MLEETTMNTAFPPPPPPPISPLHKSHYQHLAHHAVPPAPIIPPSSLPFHGCPSTSRQQQYVPPPPQTDPHSHRHQNNVIPPPRQKLRRLAWSKIPASKVLGRTNVWTTGDELFAGTRLDFDRMEELFAVNYVVGSASTASAQNGMVSGTAPTSPSGLAGAKYPGLMMAAAAAAGQDGVRPGSAPRLRRQSEEINLLDSRRSLNFNVFLRQFRLQSHAELVRIVASGESESLGPEKLRCLQRLLPADDERDALRAFSGDQTRLGNAEKFCIALMDLQSYEERIEAMLFKEEFHQARARLISATAAVIRSAQDLKSCKPLHEVLYMVLLAGNFLNTEIEEKNVTLLNFPDQLASLRAATECPVDSLKLEISSFSEQFASVFERIRKTEDTFHRKFAPFLQEARQELQGLETKLKQIELLRLELAAFYCEDETTFQLDEAFKVLSSFCDKFLRAVKENSDRRAQDLKAEERRLLLEEKLRTLDECVLRRRGSLAPSGELDCNDNNGDLVGALLFGGDQKSAPGRRVGRLSRSRSVTDTSNFRSRYDFRQRVAEVRDAAATIYPENSSTVVSVEKAVDTRQPDDHVQNSSTVVEWNNDENQQPGTAEGDLERGDGGRRRNSANQRRWRTRGSFDDGCADRERIIVGWNAERHAIDAAVKRRLDIDSKDRHQLQQQPPDGRQAAAAAQKDSAADSETNGCDFADKSQSNSDRDGFAPNSENSLVQIASACSSVATDACSVQVKRKTVVQKLILSSGDSRVTGRQRRSDSLGNIDLPNERSGTQEARTTRTSSRIVSTKLTAGSNPESSSRAVRSRATLDKGAEQEVGSSASEGEDERAARTEIQQQRRSARTRTSRDSGKDPSQCKQEETDRWTFGSRRINVAAKTSEAIDVDAGRSPGVSSRTQRCVTTRQIPARRPSTESNTSTTAAGQKSGDVVRTTPQHRCRPDVTSSATAVTQPIRVSTSCSPRVARRSTAAATAAAAAAATTNSVSGSATKNLTSRRQRDLVSRLSQPKTISILSRRASDSGTTEISPSSTTIQGRIGLGRQQQQQQQPARGNSGRMAALCTSRKSRSFDNDLQSTDPSTPDSQVATESESPEMLLEKLENGEMIRAESSGSVELSCAGSERRSNSESLGPVGGTGQPARRWKNGLVVLTGSARSVGQGGRKRIPQDPSSMEKTTRNLLIKRGSSFEKQDSVDSLLSTESSSTDCGTTVIARHRPNSVSHGGAKPFSPGSSREDVRTTRRGQATTTTVQSRRTVESSCSKQHCKPQTPSKVEWQT